MSSVRLTSGANRRGFLKIAGIGVGVAAVGLGSTSIQSGTGRAPSASKATANQLPAKAQGPLVAYIRDVGTGELAVMVQGREVTIANASLVAQLAAAVHTATDSTGV